MTHEKPMVEYDGTGKVHQSSLWGEDERNFLEDVTLNLMPDDESGKDIKGKTVMRWDSKKKKHILMKVDRDGKILKEKRNESGAKISKKSAEKNAEDHKIYKNWMKKTHLKIQNVGEIEDKRAVDLARTSSEGRHMMKQFSNRHKEELQKGEDPRSNNHIVDMKKKHLMEKMKKGGPRTGGGIHDKSVAGSRSGDK